MDHEHDEQGPARGLWLAVLGSSSEVLAVPGSGSESEGLQRARPRQRAVGHGHDGLGPARGLRLAVPGTGSEGAGLQHARVRQHAVRDFEAQGVAHTLWARTKTSRVLPEVFDSLYAAAAAKVQALWGSQLRIGRVAQLLESAIVGGAPPRHAELVPLLCPPPIVQVTRLLTVIGASVTGSDLRRDFPRTWRTGAAPPGCSWWALPSTSWVAGFCCRFLGAGIDCTEGARDDAQCRCPPAKCGGGCITTALLEAASENILSSMGEFLRRYANRLA